MLMIHLIEGGVLHHAAQVDRLNDEYAVVGQQDLDAAHDRVQLFQMEEYTGCGNQAGRAVLSQDVPGATFVKKSMPGRDATLERKPDDVFRRLNAQYPHAKGCVLR